MTVFQLYLILVSIFLIGILKNTGEAVEPVHTPLILIQTNGVQLKPPQNLSVETNFMLQEVFQYEADHSKAEIFFCPATTEKQMQSIQKANELILKHDILGAEISVDCLFVKSSFIRNFKANLPLCEEKPKPNIFKAFKQTSVKSENNEREKNIYEQEHCGPGKNDALQFLMGYQVCLDLKNVSMLQYLVYKFYRVKGFPFDNVMEFAQYKICYDHLKSQILYIKYKIISPKLLDHFELEEERNEKHEMETLGHEDIALNFNTLKEEYQKIENRKIERERRLDNLELYGFYFRIQFLAPPNHFALALWRKSAFHYANADLLHGILQPAWNYIDDLIRDYSIELTQEFDVYTGAFRLSPRTSDRVYIMEDVQIPEIWVKIVHHNYKNKDPKKRYPKAAIAIIANNYLTNDLSDLIDIHYCKQNYCRYFIADEFPSLSSFIKCCQLTDDLQDLFGIRLEFEIPLLIKTLITL